MQNDNANFKSEFNKRLINFSLEIIKLCNEIRGVEIYGRGYNKEGQKIILHF